MFLRKLTISFFAILILMSVPVFSAEDSEIPNLPELTAPADGDLIVIEDISTNITKKITKNNLISNGDKITEGDSNVEVIDIGTGEIDFDVDGAKRADIKSSGLYLSTGARINEFSIDGTLAGDSDNVLPTEKAVKTFVSANAWMSNAYQPDYNEADQGLTGNGKSAKAYIDTIASDSATLVFRHNSGAATTTYTFSTNETIPSNINTIIEKGAILSDGGGASDLTIGLLDEGTGIYKIFDWTGTGDISFGVLKRAYPEWVGADNTAAADSTSAFNKCIAAMNKGILDINSRDFRIDSTVTLKSNITIEGYGGSIDFSNAAAYGTLVTVNGSAGTARILTGNAAQGDEQLGITSAATYFTAGDWTTVRDTGVWDFVNGCICGEWVHILSVDANAVNLGADLLYGYNTAETASLDILTLKENIFLKGITAFGADGSNHLFFSSSYSKGVAVKDCTLTDFDYKTITLTKVIQFNISNNRIVGSDTAGFGYGVSLIAVAHGSIADNYFEECRHGIAVGGILLPSRFVTVKNNHVQSPTDAGLDCHPAADHIIFDGNTIQGGETAGITADGIVYQGANSIIVNNIIIGVEQHGIWIESMVDNDTIPNGHIITNNHIERPLKTGIFVEQNSAGGSFLKDIKILNNTIKSPGEHGIVIQTRTQNIEQINISHNTITGITSAACWVIYVRASTGFTISDGIISNNICHREDDLHTNIYLQGIDADSITYLNISNNLIRNGSYGGILGLNTNYCTKIGNTEKSTLHDPSISGSHSIGDLAGYEIVSAATTTLKAGEFFNISGTTNITSVTASIKGRIVTLRFMGILTFTDGSNLKLAGNFVTSADDTIQLVCYGANWYEISRSIN